MKRIIRWLVRNYRLSLWYWGFMPDGSEWVVFYIGKYRIEYCLD